VQRLTLRPAWAMSLLVTLAAALPFLGGLQGYFLSDDFGLIWLLWDKPATHFFTLFTAPWTETIYGYRADEIRPTLAFSYWLDARWGAASPLAYHFTNVLLHVANSLLVLNLARRGLALPWLWAGFAAVLFAVMPAHAETVVWISGRADSLPSLFMLTALLAFHLWRSGGRRRWYALALAAAFLALFTKQSAILLPALLVGWDVVTGGWSRLRSQRVWAGYAPFVALTAGYLVLRVVLFGNAVREDGLASGLLGAFMDRQPRYALATLTGFEQLVLDVGVLAVAGGLGLVALGTAAMFALRRAQRGLMVRVLYLGPFWWLVTVGPLAVVAYFTARHVYLTSAGVALLLALLLAELWRTRAAGRLLGTAGASLLLLGSVSLLPGAVGEWEAAGRFSAGIARDTAAEFERLPDGALLVLGAPPTGNNPAMRTWLWGFSVAFALQPPFQPVGLSEGVQVITRPEVYCCGSAWAQQVQSAVQTWASSPGRPPVVLLGWTAGEPRLLRLTDAEDPALRGQVEPLLSMTSAAELSGAVDALLGKLGPSQARFRLN